MAIITLLLFVLVAAGFLTFTIGPILAAVRNSEAHYKVRLADVFWLVALLQYPLMLVVALDITGSSFVVGFRLTMAVLLCLMIGFLWLRGVAMLNALWVENTAKRGAFLVLLLPCSIVVSIVAIWPLIAMLGVDPPESNLALAYLAVLTLLVVGLRLLSYWVLMDRHPPVEQQALPR